MHPAYGFSTFSKQLEAFSHLVNSSKIRKYQPFRLSMRVRILYRSSTVNGELAWGDVKLS